MGYLSISKGKLLKGYYKNVPYPKWVIKVLIETVGGWYISYLDKVRNKVKDPTLNYR